VAKQGDILMRFGQRVRELRQQRDLSQEEFADICGLDRTYVSGIERGKRNISLKNIAAIAKAFDLTVEQLTVGI
jgi:transcriptional regulator with XRE-family HTH domain